MSFLTKLPLQRYDSNAFGAFASEEGFSLGKGKAMAWMSQLAYELDEPDILQSRSKERCGSLRGNVLTSTG